MNNYHLNINIRKDRKGLAPIYLLLRINGINHKYGLGISVQPKEWDDVRKKVKGKTADSESTNSIIACEYARAIAIINQYKVRESASGERCLLDIEAFRCEMSGRIDTDDFIEFAFKELELRKNTISYNTYRGHKSRLNKFKSFRNKVPFNELTPKLLNDYVRFMTIKGNVIGARETALKTVRAYIKIALLHGKEFKDPFKVFKIKKGVTNREFLEKHELQRFINYYNAPGIKPHHKHTLDLFLFQCMAGFRYGDLHKLGSNMIINGALRFKPQKTQDSQKILTLPLSQMALDHIKGRHGKFFRPLALQSSNDNLKEIATKLGINKRITTHVGRHTFATLFLELGGSLEVLQYYLGHTDLKTTQLYIHLGRTRVKKEITVFDKLNLAI